MANIQSQTLQQIRHSIGRNLGVVVLGEATSTVDSASLIDTINLHGGDDEHNMNQVRIYDANCTTGITDGETSYVSDYDSGTQDATISPAFTASIVDGDEYEMWKHPWRIEDVDDAINQVLMSLTGKCPQIQGDTTLFTEESKYRYSIPSGFVALSKLEYVSSEAKHKLIEDCEAAWTGGTGTTSTADSIFERKGSFCSKNVVVSVGATTILCYKDITSIDLSQGDTVEFWLYSTVAVTASYLEIHLSSTAAIASAEETISIPAMDADTWYRHSLSLANPYLDSAIISVGFYQKTDMADFTFYVDDIDSILASSRKYVELPQEYWSIVRGTTDYIQLTPESLGIIGVGKRIRLTGYKNLTLLTADTSTCEVEPSWVINKVTGELLINHAKSPSLDIDDRKSLGTLKIAQAQATLGSITTNLAQGTRVI